MEQPDETIAALVEKKRINAERVKAMRRKAHYFKTEAGKIRWANRLEKNRLLANAKPQDKKDRHKEIMQAWRDSLTPDQKAERRRKAREKYHAARKKRLEEQSALENNTYFNNSERNAILEKNKQPETHKIKNPSATISNPNFTMENILAPAPCEKTSPLNSSSSNVDIEGNKYNYRTESASTSDIYSKFDDSQRAIKKSELFDIAHNSLLPNFLNQISSQESCELLDTPNGTKSNWKEIWPSKFRNFYVNEAKHITSTKVSITNDNQKHLAGAKSCKQTTSLNIQKLVNKSIMPNSEIDNSNHDAQNDWSKYITNSKPHKEKTYKTYIEAISNPAHLHDYTYLSHKIDNSDHVVQNECSRYIANSKSQQTKFSPSYSQSIINSVSEHCWHQLNYENSISSQSSLRKTGKIIADILNEQGEAEQKPELQFA